MATDRGSDDIERYFGELADLVDAEREPDEQFLLNLQAEATDFVRFNNNRVRQAGHVRQTEIDVDLIAGERHAAGGLDVTGDLRQDWESLNRLLHELRDMRQSLGADPYLCFNTERADSHRRRSGQLPGNELAVADITRAGADLDLVGVLASGTVYRGFANHLGQRNWHAADSFNFDWSCHRSADKAVKARYAGARWRRRELEDCMDQVRKLLELMGRAPRTLRPGRYRAYLSPAALYEMLGTLAWGGFELKAHRCRTTPLLKLALGERTLNPLVTIRENNARGFAPDFTAEGFSKPDQVTLIDQGRFAGCLAGARHAREYGEPVNAASGYPQCLDMAAGDLAQGQVLNVLGTGLYVGNLWYCNFSDRTDCRLTGLTRFATFWVEDGEIVSPVNVMRFDDSVYRMLGQNLLALTQERELIMDPGSYGCRSTASARLPGAIIDDFRLTL